MRTIAELAREAIDVQNACNPCGVAHSYAAALSDLQQHTQSTAATCQHPINRLWLCKMADMAGLQLVGVENDCSIDDAYHWCKNIVALADNDAASELSAFDAAACEHAIDVANETTDCDCDQLPEFDMDGSYFVGVCRKCAARQAAAETAAMLAADHAANGGEAC